MPTTSPTTSPTVAQAGAILEIDLGALKANYNILSKRAAPAACAAVLKADAYGLGADRVGPALAEMGCRTFFVAHLGEGIELRRILGPGAVIYVLNGPPPNEEAADVEAEFQARDLIPVLNSPQQIEQWSRLARTQNLILAAALHIDTGMARLGLSPDEATGLQTAPERLSGIDLHFVVSHLACADEPGHALNRKQRQLFESLSKGLLANRSSMGRSLANSSAIFLGPDYHFDLVRPGIALYGGNPTPGRKNPMAAVIRLRGKIIQVREIDTPQSVGYGATYRATGPRRIATVPVGYADGYLRALSGQGVANIAGMSIPIVGRVSMDLITLDVTEAPREAVYPGALVDLIGGAGPSLDDVAARAGTIGYEILTSLGRRYHRRYLMGGGEEQGHE
ncbi:MAG: alanine racemase [Rhodospirillaceae bacterium]|jgi:alanine racemase|nr:alanine racemase [Rhodospirillaceae bacterium]MBT5193721.1 alanine racemase [Rhodospirillaceae bacterium]MBT5896534.1 alanine racemase [Rhodospirillaceae bacterium]